jgi:hypothetical protein
VGAGVGAAAAAGADDVAEGTGADEARRLGCAPPERRPVTGRLCAGVAVAVPSECRTAQATSPQYAATVLVRGACAFPAGDGHATAAATPPSASTAAAVQAA